MVFTSTTPWKPRNVKFFQKVRNWRNWILSVHRVSVCREKKSPWLRQYQSYISNWYVNGKVFTSTTTWNQKILFFIFSKKFEIEFDLYFDLCWRAEIIQVGLNMHLYFDIRDASSSLWGSTSSLLWVLPVCYQICCNKSIRRSNLEQKKILRYWYCVFNSIVTRGHNEIDIDSQLYELNTNWKSICAAPSTILVF